MQKNQRTPVELPIHWTAKLLIFAWIVALVFIAGMIIGEVLGQEAFSSAEDPAMRPTAYTAPAGLCPSEAPDMILVSSEWTCSV